MAPQRNFSVGTYNIRGLKSYEQLVAEWIQRSGIAVAAITKTWLKPEDDVDYFITEHVALEPRCPNGKGYGGVALSIHPLLRYQVLKKCTTTIYQYIAIKSQGISIVGLYLSPAATAQQTEECFKEIGDLICSPFIIMGDFNARHKDWDKSENRRGRYLQKHAVQRKWTINTPKEDTHHPAPSTGNHSSTIDFFITQGIHLQRAVINSGPWDGCSDHYPVYAKTNTTWTLQERMTCKTVSHHRRLKPNLLHKAVQLYRKTIPMTTTKIEACQSEVELDTLLTSIEHTLLLPWQRHIQWKPGKPRIGWSKRIHELFKQRSKAYRRAKHTKKSEDWNAYKKLDRRVKREAKQMREIRMHNTFQQLAESSVTDASRKLSHLTREQKRKKSSTLHQGEPLDLQQFSAYIATPQGKGYVPTMHPFKVDKEFQDLVVTSIKEAQNGKSCGPDGVFVEALKTEPEMFGKLLTEIWAKCGTIQYMPLSWRSARLVPIHKKGDRSNPKNYRPITVISQLRKLIDKAIDKSIRSRYTFHPAQLGFRQNVGVEHAIIRSTRMLELGMPFTAVLDLKKAYDTVPRDKLMQIVEQKLPKHIANMIAYLLQPTILRTARDNTSKEGKDDNVVRIGVPQGDPPSTTLFNMYMDKYAEQILPHTKHYRNRNYGLIMFADDVKLQTRTAQCLQSVLNLSSAWSVESNMQWGISKCDILQPRLDTPKTFTLANSDLKNVDDVEYLGVTLSIDGISCKKSIKRCEAAHLRVKDLQSFGLNNRKLDALRTIQLSKLLLMPIAEYAIHITPPSKPFSKSYDRLQKAIIQLAIGSVPERHVPRARKLIKFPPLQYRISLLLGNLHRKLQQNIGLLHGDHDKRDLARDDFKAFIIHKTKFELPPPTSKKALYDLWDRLCKTAARPIPTLIGKYLPPILHLKCCVLRNSGLRWYFNQFLVQNRYTRSRDHVTLRKNGDYQSAYWMLRENMQKRSWSLKDRDDTEHAIQKLLQIDSKAYTHISRNKT